MNKLTKEILQERSNIIHKDSIEDKLKKLFNI